MRKSVKPGTPSVLTINGGSSSIKFALFEVDGGLQRILDGRIEGIGLSQGDFRLKSLNSAENFSKPIVATDHKVAVDILMDWVQERIKIGTLTAVGHRVVHGGPQYWEPQRITPDMIEALLQLSPFDPEHLPEEILLTEAFHRRFPDLPQIACFDTAFHHGLEPPVSRFALPRHFEEMGLRRYGFHGLSYEYVAGRLAELSQALAGSRTVVAHLGNGASLCAMRNGNSVDTTMGLTALDGLVMGTRCGAIDPGVLLYLLQALKMSIGDVERLLYHESGLLGVSGISHDVRTLLASGDPRAAEALDLFTFRIAREVSALANSLGGLECLVFTGGIGEHASAVRSAVCARLRWLGVEIDPVANDCSKGQISSSESRVDIRIIPTDEEIIIARHCLTLLR